MPRTIVGRPFSLTIDPNNAIAFNGTSQYGSIPNFPGLDALQSYTIEFWAYQDSTGGTGRQFVRLQNGATRYASISNDNGNDDVNHAVDYSSADAFGGNSSTIFTTNAWHHLAFVHDAAARQVRNYVDGVLVSNAFSQTGNSGGLLGFSGATAYLGFNSVSTFFKGRFAGLRMWNVARTEAEILANKNYYLDPDQENLTQAALVGVWNFNQGSGTSVPNSVVPGTGDLALVATPSWTTGPALTAKNYNGPRTAAGARTQAGTRIAA